MGDLQLENVVERLQRDYHVVINMGRPKVSYRETFGQTAIVHHVFKKQSGGPGQFAEVKIRFDTLPRGEGFVFEILITGGAIPLEYISAL